MFFDPGGFSFLPELTSRWRFIRQEWQELQAPILDIHRVGSVHRFAERLLQNNGWTPSWQAGSDQPNQDWLTYALSYQGMLPDGLASVMPATARLLSRLRGVEVCALSLMRPGSFIAPHDHPDIAGRLLTLHLGLAMEPGKCYLTVEGDAREEKPGAVLTFNAGREHFAVNMGRCDRVILYMEFDPRTAAFDAQA
ncbi:aspartyl/asparaginyl beta-hydroxylase domain-containing protein [Acidisoma cellulosilytica]|uniref:Aspartyl/asparaginyl beta-hydroxylase domain-containing protein n=1 Tax=Acidisoma cellulosilyticum TaxID=2802395 RepID=A0A963Z6F5_9PROT|nr:aspartyl/asparaginyl beta-hydroxylase domain-containing protein [Acidisoma cellulosilyticum]MCB8883361.1 aspartyl/asparaginyl beta-hydroxylase domain-containing protein [Acidisoma cellulosilyticum]